MLDGEIRFWGNVLSVVNLALNLMIIKVLRRCRLPGAKYLRNIFLMIFIILTIPLVFEVLSIYYMPSFYVRFFLQRILINILMVYALGWFYVRKRRINGDKHAPKNLSVPVDECRQ